MLPQDQWTEPEKWVWETIRAGRAADFNEHEKRADALSPMNSQGWDAARRLRSDFLRQILFSQPHRGEIPAQGLRIAGAWFDEAVDLDHGRLAHQLWFEHCRFEQPANFAGLQIDGWFSLEGSVFVEQHTEQATTPDTSEYAVDLNGANITGHVSFIGARLNGLELTGAKIGGNLDLEDATIGGKLIMHGLSVTQHLFMRMGEESKAKKLPVGRFEYVELGGAKIDGNLELSDVTVDGKLSMDSLVVGGHGYMRGSTFKEPMSLPFARFGGNLDLSNSEITELDLSGARIDGELRLGSQGHKRTRWRKPEGLSLNLRNVHAGALQDRVDRTEDRRPWWHVLLRRQPRCEDSWPAEIQLDGFTYDRLGGYGGNPDGAGNSPGNCDVDMLARDVRWYVDWLARDHSYGPQPYEQLARAFRAAGDPTKANRILYESRRRARNEARKQHKFGRWLGSLFLDWSIGYGLGGRYFRALAWVVAFTALGTAVLYFSGQPRQGMDPGLSTRVVYSLDQLLPIVEFEKYDKVELKGGVAYYFYAQKLVGWMLGSFLVAGLAGLTQKQ